MSKPERQLRFYQIACILLVVGCIFVSRLAHYETQGSITFGQWLILLAAIWSAISGFTVQRRIVRIRNQSLQSARRSTPLSRWRVGNVIRIASAASVGLWALVLKNSGGPALLVNSLFGIGLVLLLIWRPGTIPDSTQS